MFSTKPFKSILDLVKAFPTEESCVKHLESIRWEGKVVSPFEAASNVYSCPNNKYKCKSTNKYFNVRTGTIFEGTKIPLQQWFMAIYLFTSHKKGISSHQLAKDLAITQKSAWFMLQRIRSAMEHETFLKFMEGTVQVDETFVGGKNKNRHADKKVNHSQGRAFIDKTAVVGMLNVETKQVKCVVSVDTSRQTIHPILKDTIKPGTILIADDWHAYNGLEDTFNMQRVDHARKQYVNDCGATTNGIENFWTNFKHGIIGIYNNNVSRKHLQKYANEFTFRYNTKSEATDTRMNLLLQSANGKRLTYQKLIAK